MKLCFKLVLQEVICQNIKECKMINKLINFSELSRYVTKGDRTAIRITKIPKKWHKEIDNLIYKDLPKWWETIKKK